MTTSRAILTLAGVLVLGAVSASLGETFTFNKTNDVWDNAENWIPGDGPPGAGDTAIIPINRTCRVEDADQAAQIIQVYGTLGLVGHDLELISGASTSKIDGILYFKEADGHVPELHFIAGHSLEGSGTITAKRDHGYGPGLIKPATGDGAALRIEPGLTVTGSIRVWNLWLHNRGDFIVNHPDDEMQLEQDIPWWPVLRLRSDGSIQVSAGKLHVGAMNIDSSAAVSFRLSGGEMKFVGQGILDTQVPFTVTGGVLDIQRNLRTSGASVFRNATIKVKQGKAVEFD